MISVKSPLIIIRVLMVLCLISSLAGLSGIAVIVLFYEQSSWLDKAGVLHEPLFWIVPCSALSLLLSVGLMIVILIMKYCIRQRRGQDKKI